MDYRNSRSRWHDKNAN